jgi:hypothetical protein
MKYSLQYARRDVIGTIKTGTLQNSVISAVAHEGLTVTTRDGKPARIAIIDELGNVIGE